jgi:NADPH2:quinone reductase
MLVRVRATSVNRADLLQRRGNYPPPAGVPSDIPGMDYAGVVEKLGDGVTRWRVGDRVMGLVGGGSYAEYVVTHEDEALRIPERLSFEEAAAIPEAFLTAHDALFTQMQLAAGETVVIHAVTSGVGTAGLQLAREHGAYVLGTGRSAAKLERAQGLGLDVAIDASRADWVEAVLSTTQGRGAHVIMDLVGGNYFAGDIAAATRLGRIILVGLVAGARADLDLRMLLNKRLLLRGTMLRSRTLQEKIAVTRAFEETGLPLLTQGKIVPVIDAVLPMTQAAEAHRIVENNENFGKIVLTWEAANA